jgi:hypothetical protein
VDEVRAESWTHLHELLFANAWHERLHRFRSNFAFRGESDAANDLRTSLVRRCGEDAEVETHLLRNFRKYAARSEAPDDSVWTWLALAKHHGLPTRLLDWTYSPYVALHFATHNPDEMGRDGAVWLVDFVRANGLLPDALRRPLEREGSNALTTEMLAGATATLDDLDALGDDFVVFFEPPAFDERIVNQYALFSLMPGSRARLDDWLGGHPELARRILVPAELKWEVRDKLDQANITERVLFPGLDGLCSWLTRYFSPRE